MPGGLLQIASSGIQDRYLTKNPEITFFKKTYRRYTNFSKELIEVSLENSPDFGEQFFVTIPKYGDLVHRSFLKVEIPKLIIDDSYITNENYKTQKTNKLSRIQTDVNLWNNEYNKMVQFSNIQINYYSKIQILLQSQDVSFDSIKKKTFNEKNMTSNTLDEIVFSIDEDIKDKVDIISYVYNLDRSFGIIDSSENKIITYDTFKININKLYQNNLKQLKYYHSNYIYNQKLYNLVSKGDISYAWVKNLGHHYFSRNEIELNGEQMEIYSNDYLNIYQSHHLKDEHIENYNEIIGNVNSINNFSITKESNSLFIPTIFWFNRNSSFSLPLVSMKHSDAQFNFTINNLESLIYFEDYQTEFKELTKLVLPFNKHTNNGNSADAIYNTNSEISETDISDISYLKDERIYIYQFKYITKELIKQKYENLTTSQINSLFTLYSSNGTTMTLEDWIKFRLNYLEYTADIITVSKEINYNNNYEYIDTNYLRNKVELPKIKIYLEYIFLDELERFKFAKNNLEYVVSFPNELVSHLDNQENFSFNLNLVKPTKDIFWFVRPNLLKNGFSKYSDKNPNLYNQYYFDNNKIIKDLTLFLQDNKLIDFAQNGENLYLYTNKYEKLNRTGLKEDSNYYYYTFCLYPENNQPSGTANLSIIKGKTFQLTINPLFLTSYFNSKINLNQQNIELIFIYNSYSLLNFNRGRVKKVIY